MNDTQHKVVIVGCGPGAPEFVTPASRSAVQAADVLVGSQRLLDLFPDHPSQRVAFDAPTGKLVDRISDLLAAGRRVAVLVSGDPGLFSLARTVISRLGRSACRIVPAVSSVQVAFARLGLDWADARIISAHNRQPNATVAELAGVGKIAILCGRPDAIAWSASVASSMSGTHEAFLCENLTLANERVEQLVPSQLPSATSGSLVIVLLIRRNLLD